MDKQQLDELIKTLSRKPPCKVGKWVSAQDQAFQTTFANAIVVSNRYKVWRACIKLGLDATNSTFYRHCAQECSCYSQL